MRKRQQWGEKNTGEWDPTSQLNEVQSAPIFCQSRQTSSSQNGRGVKSQTRPWSKAKCPKCRDLWSYMCREKLSATFQGSLATPLTKPVHRHTRRTLYRLPQDKLEEDTTDCTWAIQTGPNSHQGKDLNSPTTFAKQMASRVHWKTCKLFKAIARLTLSKSLDFLQARVASKLAVVASIYAAICTCASKQASLSFHLHVKTREAYNKFGAILYELKFFKFFTYLQTLSSILENY